MKISIKFPGPKKYSQAQARDKALAMIPISMAAALLEVEVSTVQGYVRRGVLPEIVVGHEREWVGVPADRVRAMRLQKLQKVRRLVELAEPILCDAAEKGVLVEYGSGLMEPLGLDHTHSRDRDLIGRVLGDISTKTYYKEGRLLSVLAVRKDTGMPNDQFFGLAKELGAMPGAMQNGRFFLREKKAVFRAYR